VREHGSLQANASLETHEGRPTSPRSLRGRLPNFLVIGAMKSGTTSLFQYLRSHPAVFMSPLKEVDFFVEERNLGKGLDWYRKQFDGAGPEATAVGEASTSYTKYPEYRGVPQRIATWLPDARLIYVVRDPIERIRSHYQHRALIGEEHAPFDVAVLRDPRYVDCSRFALQIEQYLQHFSRENLLVFTAEELRLSRATAMRRVYRFLEVADQHVPQTLNREFYTTEEHAAYPPMAWWLRRMVKKHLPDGRRAKKLVDRIQPSLARLGLQKKGSTQRAPVVVSESVRDRLEDLLRDDVGRLRAYMPDDFDGWGIA